MRIGIGLMSYVYWFGLMSYVYWFGLMLIGFLMIPVFDKNISSSFYSVLATHLIELDSSSTITSPTCHSARRACPKLQNPLPLLAKNNLLHREKVPTRANEG